MIIKRFERLDIATSDLADAISIYEKNFDFTVKRASTGDEATIELGPSQLRLRADAGVADLISSFGEGLAAIWLEADDVAQVALALTNANIVVSPLRVEGDKRILEVAPASANMVPLFIFDRR
jgi:hypothetical protein